MVISSEILTPNKESCEMVVIGQSHTFHLQHILQVATERINSYE